MNYSNAKKYLEKFHKFGIKLGLDRIKHIMELLDNPQNNYLTIHVAGTNGKGSVCAMLSSILKEAGFKVGLYTSPHLIDYTERIKINNFDISKREFADIVEKIKELIERKYKLTELPTEFELLTACAFWYFAQKEVDIAVIETGLGGKYDSTNIIKPIVSAITNIDYDHCDLLGNTIEKIAKQKAGIIKPNIPLVTSVRNKIALNVIKKTAKRNNSQILFCGLDKDNDVIGEFVKYKNMGQIINFSFMGKKVKNIFLPFLGKHQLINASVVIGIILLFNDYLRNSQTRRVVHISSIRNGFRKSFWPCRMQVLKQQPLVIVDGAHNPAGIKSFYNEVSRFIKEKDKVISVVGIMKDKNFKEMINTISKYTDKAIVVSPKNPRACSTDDLEKMFRKNNTPVEKSKSVKEGFVKALRQASANDIICICGSLYVCGEVLKANRNN